MSAPVTVTFLDQEVTVERRMAGPTGEVVPVVLIDMFQAGKSAGGVALRVEQARELAAVLSVAAR